MPVWAEVAGAVCILASYAIIWRVLAENSFAAPVVRIQEERGQRIVTTGPYGIVRHPMYGGAILSSARDAAAARLVLRARLRAAAGDPARRPPVFEERSLAERFPEYAAYAENGSDTASRPGFGRATNSRLSATRRRRPAPRCRTSACPAPCPYARDRMCDPPAHDEIRSPLRLTLPLIRQPRQRPISVFGAAGERDSRTDCRGPAADWRAPISARSAPRRRWRRTARARP